MKALIGLSECNVSSLVREKEAFSCKWNESGELVTRKGQGKEEVLCSTFKYVSRTSRFKVNIVPPLRVFSMLCNLMVLFVLQLIQSDNPFDPPFQEKCAQDKGIDNTGVFQAGYL